MTQQGKPLAAKSDVGFHSQNLWGARQTQDFLRAPDESCVSMSGADLTQPVWSWSQGLKGVMVEASEETTQPPRLWLSVLRQLCLR